jgi:hydroxymethylglutaryl-CoA lyase
MSISCAKSFGSWLKSNSQYLQIYKKLGSPKPFDVSLRDGLQSSKEILDTTYKFNLFVRSCVNYEPQAVEIGSLVSPKVLPMLADSSILYKMSREVVPNLMPLYLLIPSISKLEEVVELGCSHISLISSVSEKFQIANTKKTLEQTKKDIKYISDNFQGKIKLYLSCIDTCPLAGPIDHKDICDQIVWYWRECKVNTICLSDTVGQLKPKSFVSIIDQIHLQGVPYKSISLHLHVGSESDVIDIMAEALERGITGFDVSYLETGGCSVTMGMPSSNGKPKTKPNLSYPLYYRGLVSYIQSKI